MVSIFSVTETLHDTITQTPMSYQGKRLAKPHIFIAIHKQKISLTPYEGNFQACSEVVVSPCCNYKYLNPCCFHQKCQPKPRTLLDHQEGSLQYLLDTRLSLPITKYWPPAYTDHQHILTTCIFGIYF